MIKYYIILTFLVLTNFVNAQLTAGLTAYWGLDEESGTIVDSVGSNDGTVTGATYEATGKLNTCLSFDGNGDYITFPDVADLQGYGDDFGMGAWIYPTQYSGDDYRYIFGGEEYAFGMAINAISEALVMRVIGAYSSPSSSFTIPLNQWSFVYCQIDYSETTNDVSFYCNGTMNTVTFNHDATSGSSTNLIGCREVGHDYFIGRIDDSFITKTLKTEAQLDSIYNLGAGKIYPWDFSEGTGLESGFIRSEIAQSMWRIEVQKIAFRIPYESEGEEEETEISTYHMDGTCPESTHRWDDYDCAENDFDNLSSSLAISDTNDFAEVIYIDPDAPPEGDGTYGSPYDSWEDIGTGTNNYAYVQKRGTTCEITSTFAPTANGFMMGAYGEGERPIIHKTNAGDIIDIDYKVCIRDLSIRGYAAVADAGELIFFHGAADESFVYNCELSYAYIGLFLWADKCRLINNEISYMYLDGIWTGEASYIEISHNNIHHINRAYDTNPSESVAGGDGIQFAYNWSQGWIHDNIIDRSTEGNKFCLAIIPDVTKRPYNQKFIIEFNSFTGPPYDEGGGASVMLDSAKNSIIQYNHFKGVEGTGSNGRGIWLEYAYNDTLMGNTFEGYWIGIQGATPNMNIILNNNTFYDNDGYIAVNIDGKFYNNIFSVPTGASSFSNINLDDESNNLFTITVPVGWSGSFHGNPHYVDSLNSDFTLQSNSDAIDAGIELDYYNYDITKKEITGDTDCGAYEHNLWWLIMLLPFLFFNYKRKR